MKDKITELSLKESDDITYTYIRQLYAKIDDKEPELHHSVKVTLTDVLRKNFDIKDSVKESSVGNLLLWVFLFKNNTNLKAAIEPIHDDLLTKRWNKKFLGNIEDHIAKATLDGIVTVKEHSVFVEKYHWYGFAFSHIINATMEAELLTNSDSFIKEKEKLVKERQDRLDKKDINASDEIIDILLNKKLKEYEKDDHIGIEIYKAGEGKGLNNTYKNMVATRGFLPSSNDASKINYSSSSLADGIKPEELHTYADFSILGASSRAISTQDGGVIVKQYVASFGHVHLDKKGTDCGTKKYLKILIKPKNKQTLYLQYHNVKGKNILLTDEELDKQMGKEILLRSPQFCVADDICNICAGERYYRLNNVYKGDRIPMASFTAKVGSKLLNAALKKFHQVNVEFLTFNLMDNLKPYTVPKK